jgi:hypothetical protein
VSTFTPAPSVQPSGPTRQELAEQRERQKATARKEALAKERERQRLLAERLRKQREQAVEGGFAAFLGLAAVVPGLQAAPATTETPADTAEAATGAPPQTVDAEAAAQTVAAPFAEPASSPALQEAGPVLLGLLGLSVLLLGLAALPPTTVRSTVLGPLLAQRRLEIGLIGTAVLASAAIGLAIAVAAG